MNRRVRQTVALAAALGLGAAGAQDLKAYAQLASSLDQAARVRPSSAQAALTRLDAAQVAFEQLAPTLRNRQIVSGLRDALTGARGALARTPAELEAQVLLARGLMRKALYDQTMTLLGSAPANGAAQLRLLSSEFGLNGAASQALVTDSEKGRLARVAWRLQRTAAQKVVTALDATRPEQTTASYVNLARATGWFTVVQDAAGAKSLKVSQFGDALRQLTSGETAALSQSLTTLRQGAATLSRSLANPPEATTPATPTPVDTTTPDPDSVPVVVQPPTTQNPAAQNPATQNPATQTPANQNPANQNPAVTLPSSASAEAVYGELGRALSAAGHADLSAAREHLVQAGRALAAAPADLRSAAGYSELVFNLTAAQGRKALRPADVQALLAQLGNVERAAAGQPIRALDQVSAGVARGLSGWLRVLVFALLAALSAVPLYLLNLAFGGRNTYWRAVGAGLALLLLPIFLEGLFGLLGAVGDVAGVAGLRSLLNLTLTQGAYALPVWALLAALSIGLLSFGFRGLCQQFGLLGRVPTPKNTTQQNLDWDEDV